MKPKKHFYNVLLLKTLFLIAIGGTITNAYSQNYPTVQAGPITYSNLSDNSMTLTWTNPPNSGSRKLVVMRQGNSVNQEPVDGTTYSASSDFSTAPVLGATGYNNKIIYNGTGATVTVTGLSANTTYYIEIFGFNTVGGYQYYAVTPGTTRTGSKLTLATEPGSAAGSLSFSNVGTSFMTVTWNTTSSNNGTHKLVVARAGQAVGADPVDGTTYSTSSVFGSGDALGGGYVVYNGQTNGGSFTLTGLTNGVTYHFEIFGYNNNSASIPNYATGTTRTGSQASMASQPTIQASDLIVKQITPTSARLVWTNGNGSNRLVVLRAGASSTVPTAVDGTSYTASTTFGNGDPLGGGYVVYKNTSSAGARDSVTITELSPATNYVLGVYEFNLVGTDPKTINYTTQAQSLKSGFGTLANQPTIQSSNLKYIDVAQDSVKLKWTKGNGERRIVVSRLYALPTWVPTDGVRVEAGDDLGDNTTVMGVTDADSLIVKNLQPNTNYLFKIFEYNGEGNGAEEQFINYNTVNPLMGIPSLLTLDAEPTTAASDITFSNITTSSIQVHCRKGDGYKRLILAKAESTPELPVDGNGYKASSLFKNGDNINETYVIYNGTDTTVTVTGLNSGTEYFFTVVEYTGFPYLPPNTIDTLYNTNYLTGTVATASATTQQILVAEPNQGATNLIYGSPVNGTMTIKWTKGDGNGRMLIGREAQPVNHPVIDGVTYTANADFGAGEQTGPGNFVLYSGDADSVIVTGLLDRAWYHFALFEYNALGNEVNYIANALTGNKYVLSEPNQAATNITYSNLTQNNITLTWENGNGDGRILLVKIGSPVDAIPTDDIVYTANPAIGGGDELGTGNFVLYSGTENTVTIEGLSDHISQNTTYHFALFEYNQDGSGIINYMPLPLTSSKPVMAEPNQVSTNMDYRNKTDLPSVTIGWENGNGTGRILLAKQGSAVDATPVDGIVYTADTVFALGNELGSGNYVVYNGTGDSVTITGFITNYNYHFALFEYNQDGVDLSAINYNPTPLTGNTSFGTVGIFAQESTNVVLNIFPNPNHGSFTITANQAIKTVEIVDVLGKVVFRRESKATASEKSIQVEKGNWSEKGIYFLKVTTDEGIATKRLVIE